VTGVVRVRGLRVVRPEEGVAAAPVTGARDRPAAYRAVQVLAGAASTDRLRDVEREAAALGGALGLLVYAAVSDELASRLGSTS
jgi:hypothetical protein